MQSAVFQPTRPVRGATRHGGGMLVREIVSTHAPRAGRDLRRLPATSPWCAVSTHAPRAGRDYAGSGKGRNPDGFNPRAPCGARPQDCLRGYPASWFQPTRPVRGATCCPHAQGKAHYRFNPRAPCGARRECIQRSARSDSVSTHAPRAGRDAVAVHRVGLLDLFQPTRPVRGATRLAFHPALSPPFQPTRPVRGATLWSLHRIGLLSMFQPTRPVRGATPASARAMPSSRSFNPRAPCGARLRDAALIRNVSEFQPTRPVRGAT